MNTVKLNVVQIVNGLFSDIAEGRQGNFTGYDAQGEQFFISKKSMNGLGITKDEEFKPFYITVTEKEFNVLDSDGNTVIDPVTQKTQTFKRIQAGAVFANRVDAMNATLDSKFFELEQAKAIQDKANELELSADVVRNLVATI